MYMKCDSDIDSTPAFPESGQAYGCFSDGADRTDCPVNLSGKERFAYEKREAALHKYEDGLPAGPGMAGTGKSTLRHYRQLPAWRKKGVY